MMIDLDMAVTIKTGIVTVQAPLMTMRVLTTVDIALATMVGNNG